MPEERINPAETYESFLVPSLFTPWARLLVERAAPEPGERVLDLACGTGVVTRHVAPLVGRTGTVVAVDISADMLEVARAIPPGAEANIVWSEGDAAALDLPDGSFDLAICQQGMQFFPDREAAARAIHRVLKAGGRAVIAVWQSLDRHELLKALFTAEANHLHLPLEQVATPFSLTDEGVLRDLLLGAGFATVEIEPAAMEVSFPSAEQWLELTVRAGAAVIPELAQEESSFDDLLGSITREVQPVVDRHRTPEGLSFPMHSHIAVARK